MRDSFLVYGRFLRFSGASLISALADYILLYLILSVPAGTSNDTAANHYMGNDIFQVLFRRDELCAEPFLEFPQPSGGRR